MSGSPAHPTLEALHKPENLPPDFASALGSLPCCARTVARRPDLASEWLG